MSCVDGGAEFAGNGICKEGGWKFRGKENSRKGPKICIRVNLHGMEFARKSIIEICKKEYLQGKEFVEGEICKERTLQGICMLVA